MAACPSFLQVPLSKQTEMIEAGRRVTEAMVHFMREQCLMDERAAHAHHKTSRVAVESEIPRSSLQAGLSSLLELSLGAGKHHAQCAARLRDECTLQLEQAMANQGDRVMRAKLSVQRCINAAVEAEERHAKMKRKLLQVAQEEDAMKTVLSRLQAGNQRIAKNELERVHDKVLKLRERRSRMDGEIELSRAKLFEAICRRDSALRSASQEFEASERERAATVSSVLRCYHLHRRNLHVAQLAALDDLGKALELVNPEEDVNLTIADNVHPDYTHAYGKALSLLDWAWGLKTQGGGDSSGGGDGSGGSGETTASPRDPSSSSSGSSSSSSSSSSSEEEEKKAVVPTSLLKLLNSTCAEDAGHLVETILPLLPHAHERAALHRILHERRSESGELSRAAFDGLGRVLGALLDACERGQETDQSVRSARQVMILANTFYTTVDSPGEGDDKRDYLQQALSGHALWQGPNFWEKVLKFGVQEVLSDVAPEQGRWDDMGQQARREAVLSVHNCVFSQLASIAFNMIEYGFPRGEIFPFIEAKCKKSELGEDQVLALTRDVHHRLSSE